MFHTVVTLMLKGRPAIFQMMSDLVSELRPSTNGPKWRKTRACLMRSLLEAVSCVA